MAVRKRVIFNAADEPVLTVTVTGHHDVFRFAWAMAHLQCDFSDVGRRIAGSLKRHMGVERFREIHEHFTSNKTLRWVRDDDDLFILAADPLTWTPEEYDRIYMACDARLAHDAKDAMAAVGWADA